MKSPLETLAEEPYRFQFDAAVRLLEAGAEGGSREDAIRFAAPPVLTQPVVEVAAAERAGPEKRARLVTALIGLIGPSGEMPRWYTELLAQAQRQKSHAVVDFFNLLAQRLIAAFAAAGAKYRLPRSAERLAKAGTEEPIGGALLAFTGYGTPGLEARLGFSADALRHYAGFFAAYPRSASRLASMVSDYLARPAEIVEFAGAWLPIAPDQQSRLPLGRRPGAFHILGLDVAIGVRAWDQQARFIVKIGPLDLPEFLGLLPDRPRLKTLVSLIRAYVGWEADFAVQLILLTAEIPALTLKTALPDDAPRLGWSSWLPTACGTIRGQTKVGDAMFSAAVVEGLQS